MRVGIRSSAGKSGRSRRQIRQRPASSPSGVATAEGAWQPALVEVFGFLGNLPGQAWPRCGDAVAVAARPAATLRVGHMCVQRAAPHVRQVRQDCCHAHVYLPPGDRATLQPASPVAVHTSDSHRPKQPIGGWPHCATDRIRWVTAHWLFPPRHSGARHSERDTPLQQPDSAARRQWINGCLYVANSVADVTGRLTSASSSRPRTAVGSPPRRHRSEATAQPRLYANRVTLKSGTAKVLRSTPATESVSPLSSSVDGTRQVSASPWFVLPRRTAARQGSLGCPPPRRDPQRGTSWRGDPCVRLPPSPRVAPPQQPLVQRTRCSNAERLTRDSPRATRHAHSRRMDEAKPSSSNVLKSPSAASATWPSTRSSSSVVTA